MKKKSKQQTHSDLIRQFFSETSASETIEHLLQLQNEYLQSPFAKSNSKHSSDVAQCVRRLVVLLTKLEK